MISSVSSHQLKQTDKTELRKRHEIPSLGGVKLPSIHEISVRKHQHYLTVITNYETGGVIGVVRNTTYQAVASFLKKQRMHHNIRIEAVAMDTWDPYIKALREQCTQAAIVFDLFHVAAALSKVIDKIRNDQYRRASTEIKALMKGSRSELLRNPQNLRPEDRPGLQEILGRNQPLATAYLLKDYVKRMWQ